MKSHPSDGSQAETNVRRSRSTDLDDDENFIEMPDTFEDYDELNGDNDATPDDRRRDPLRRSW
jgi:hypothetical protein